MKIELLKQLYKTSSEEVDAERGVIFSPTHIFVHGWLKDANAEHVYPYLLEASRNPAQISEKNFHRLTLID